MSYEKGRLFRNQDYMEYVRTQTPVNDWGEMAACPRRFENQYNGIEMRVAHHVRMGGNGGTGIKPSDYRTVSLNALDHQDLHNVGEKSFWARHGVDPDEAIIILLTNYVKDRKKLISTLEDLIESERG